MRAVMISMIVLLASNAFAYSPVAAPNFDPPKIALEQAIKLATSCLTKKKTDVSDHYLKSVNFERVGITARLWMLRWEWNTLAKGGWIDVSISEAGSCQIRYGE